MNDSGEERPTGGLTNRMASPLDGWVAGWLFGVNNEGDPLAAVATPPLMAELMDLGKGGKIPLPRY